MLSISRRRIQGVPNSRRFLASLPNPGTQSGAVHTRIGDVELRIFGSGASHLIPRGHLAAISPLSKETTGHLRWLAQKFALGQDSLLLGHPGPLRRQLVLAFAEAVGIEVEHLRLTRDTTESDLKQRRELRVGGGGGGGKDSTDVAQSVIFHDQAPVRAALHGRLLLLEGLESAERNVLPTLNNLLENREMQLEDGRLLGSATLPVHPQFRVIALGLQVPPYGQGHSLDPPLRSRFQARHIDALSSESVAACLSNRLQLSSEKNKSALVSETVYRQNERQLLALYETMRGLRATALEEGLPLHGLPSFSLRQLEFCLGLGSGHTEKMSSAESFAKRIERVVPALTWLQDGVSPRLRPTLQASWEGLTSSISPARSEKNGTPSASKKKGGARLTADQSAVLDSIHEDILRGQHICLLGPRGSGKSELSRKLAERLDLPSNRSSVFPLYAELTARDLLQRRETDVSGNTVWADSQLVRMVKNGGLCILDGIDRVDSNILVVLQSLLHEGTVVLPSGELLHAHKDFRAMALGIYSAGNIRTDDLRNRYLGSELELCYHSLPAMDVSTMFHVSQGTGSEPISKKSQTPLSRAALHLSEAAEKGMPELALNLRHLLRLRRLGYLEETVANTARLRNVLEGTLMTRFLSPAARAAFDEALIKAEISSPSSPVIEKSVRNTDLVVTDTEVSIGDVKAQRRTPRESFRVPAPLFYANDQHMHFLREMLHSYVSGERAILLVGNQGVGKNKLIDRMLQLLNAEREYIQLHRDSTLQSLTLLPTLENGRVAYQESPLVIAARTGRVLVVDEADKAPLEVVAVLKSLAEDGELALPDGRRLLRRDRWLTEQSHAAPLTSEQEIAKAAEQHVLLIHDAFRLVVLANRPGMPFLGNNFFRECGDVFHSFIVENLPRESETALLRAYGPSVRDSVLSRLTASFAALRKEHDNGHLSYPYSAREAVAVVKHIQAYPADGVLAAIENVLQFESLAPSVRAHVAGMFQANGIPVPTVAGTVAARPAVRLAPVLASPAPEVKLVKRAASNLNLRWTAVQLHDQPWQSASVSSQRVDMRSSRISVFSEEAAVLRVGRPEESSGRRELRTMINQPKGLQVLTTSPLELHSFWGITLPDSEGRTNITQEAESTYVRHELLSANMGWRLGQFSPLLAPASDGVTVILPELSMALYVPNSTGTTQTTTSAEATMLTLPDLKTFLAPNVATPGESKRGILSNLFSSTAESAGGRLADMQITHARSQEKSDGLSVLWRPGIARFAVLDMARKKLAFISVGDAAENMGIVSISLNAANECIVCTAGGQHYSVPLAPIAGNVLSGALQAQSLSSEGYSIRKDSTATFTGKEGLMANGSVSYHASLVSDSQNNSDRLTAWPRSDSASEASAVKEPLQVLRSIPGDGSVHSITTKVGSGTFLELSSVDSGDATKPLLIRRIPLSNVSSDNEPVAVVDMSRLTANSTAVLFSDGVMRLYETDEGSLLTSLQAWEAMHGPEDAANWTVARLADGAPTNSSPQRFIPLDKHGRFDQTSTPKTGLDAPKHGKEDPKNEPHVGGNTWAGGTGGSDTAGLGGRGGPYRLDKGHTIHQVSEADKSAVSDEARAEAARMAKEGLKRRLEEIRLGKGAFGMYLEYRNRVEGEISQLKGLVDEIARRAKERVWLRRQTHGELDDSRLIDGLAGDRLIYKRRGDPDQPRGAHRGNSGTPTEKKLHFVVDVSGSMYRFNGQDRRLERLLEAVLLAMESMPTDKASPIKYSISGHSGDSPDIPFLSFEDDKPSDEGSKYAVLEAMVAHSQYCMSGDYTARAAELAINGIAQSSDSEGAERYVIVVSDANFERYGIQPAMLEKILLKDSRVKAHMILIASLGGEAESVVQLMPGCKGQIHTCYNTAALPSIFRKILLEAIGDGVA